VCVSLSFSSSHFSSEKPSEAKRLPKKCSFFLAKESLLRNRTSNPLSEFGHPFRGSPHFDSIFLSGRCSEWRWSVSCLPTPTIRASRRAKTDRFNLTFSSSSSPSSLMHAYGSLRLLRRTDTLSSSSSSRVRNDEVKSGEIQITLARGRECRYRARRVHSSQL